MYNRIHRLKKIVGVLLQKATDALKTCDRRKRASESSLCDVRSIVIVACAWRLLYFRWLETSRNSRGKTFFSCSPTEHRQIYVHIWRRDDLCCTILSGHSKMFYWIQRMVHSHGKRSSKLKRWRNLTKKRKGKWRKNIFNMHISLKVHGDYGRRYDESDSNDTNEQKTTYELFPLVNVRDNMKSITNCMSFLFVRFFLFISWLLCAFPSSSSL